MLRLAALAALLCAFCASQAIPARFADPEQVFADFFEITPEGFRADHPGAMLLRFPETVKYEQFQPSRLGFASPVAPVDGSRPVRALRVNLLRPGFGVEVARGFSLSSGSLTAPLLSFPQGGSVGPGNPTPPANWLLLSFQTEQPPILFVFEGGEGAMSVEGASGRWSISVTNSFEGWIQVISPLGQGASTTLNAAELGRLTGLIRETEPFWIAPGNVRLLEQSVESDEFGLTWKLRFDGSGVVVPPALFYSLVGDYGPRIQSATKRWPLPATYGPAVSTLSNELTVRFPMRRVPVGRPATIGIVPGAENLKIDLESAVALSRAGLGMFLASSPESLFEDTKQSLERLRTTNRAADLLGASALVLQAYEGATGPLTGGNAPLQNLIDRMDWLTFSLLEGPLTESRFAMANACLAASLSPSTDVRLYGALFQTGLSGQIGLNRYLRDVGLPGSIEEVPDYYSVLRADLFSPVDQPRTLSPFAEALFSPMRLYGARSLSFTEAPSVEGTATSTQSSEFLFAVFAPPEAGETSNIAALYSRASLGVWLVRVRPEAEGPWSFKFSWPDYAPPIPASPGIPEP
jgi:hypothetical protein